MRIQEAARLAGVSERTLRYYLNGMIELTERALKGEKGMSFEAFDSSELEHKREAYAQEARERWGHTPEYAESARRTAGYGKGDWAQLQQGMTEIFAQFAALRGQAPDSEAVQALVARWQAYISDHFYTCSREMLAGLGQMYTADERFMRNIDQAGEGTAALMSAAIAHYCAG